MCVCVLMQRVVGEEKASNMRVCIHRKHASRRTKRRNIDDSSYIMPCLSHHVLSIIRDLSYCVHAGQDL